jgi:hypothetical protein
MPAAVLPRPAHCTAPKLPTLATEAPTRPPIRACELEEGMPAHQVIRFQLIAPIRAAKIRRSPMMWGSMIPAPTILATLVPKKMKAMKLKNAAHSTAHFADSTRVETMVAIELAASCRPFRKSKPRATTTSMTRKRKVGSTRPARPRCR